MVENILLKEQLTNEMIEDGAQLTQRLEDLGLPIYVAMWFFDSEINEWRLKFATPELLAKGPRTVYTRIQEARKSLGAKAERLPSSMIGLLYPNDQLVEGLRIERPTGPGISRVRIKKSVVNRRYVDDILLYKSAA